MIEKDYIEKFKKAETMRDVSRIAHEIYDTIQKQSFLEDTGATMLKIYMLAGIVLKIVISMDIPDNN